MGALFLFGLDFAFIVAAPAPRRRAKMGFAETPLPTSSEAGNTGPKSRQRRHVVAHLVRGGKYSKLK